MHQEGISNGIKMILRDLKSRDEAWIWLAKELEPALRVDEADYIQVDADDVITRNTQS